MFGLGGKYVEVFNDTQIRSAYLDDKDVEEIISQTKIGKILEGVRGEKSIDFRQLKNTIYSVSKIIIKNKSILEIDLNPVIVNNENSLNLVDIKIKTTN